MQITAFAKSVQIGPRKVRLVAEVIRNKKVSDAERTLALLHKRGAWPLDKLLKSAVANASHNLKISVDNLRIKTVEVSEGPTYKRFHPSTRGRIHPYKRRTSHIRIILEDTK